MFFKSLGLKSVHYFAILGAMQAFRWKNRVRFHQADPAGWMFFGRAFEIAHDCFEDFLTEAGFPWREWFQNPNYAMPIRKAECDYHRPLPAGEAFEIEARVVKLGNTSISFEFKYIARSEVCMILSSTHVLINTQTQTPCPWPETFRTRLAPYESPTATGVHS